jgi:predicted amidohydrolase YtcJ
MTGYPRAWSGDDWLSFGSLKIGIDGSLGAQTALLYEPYANDPSTKGVYVGDKKLNYSLVTEAHEKNGQIAIHAIGDKAIKEAVDLIEGVLKENPREDHRCRIEHYEYPRDDDIERTANLRIIPSMQPNFIGEWGWPEGMYEIRLGKNRNKRSNPYKRLIDKGLHVAFGSDGMPFHPLYGVWSAVNHPNPASRISAVEAIRSYTLEGAYATREEHIKGSIEVGKLADVVILPIDITNPEFYLKSTNSDIIEESKKTMKKKKVHLTIINGEIVFQA